MMTFSQMVQSVEASVRDGAARSGVEPSRSVIRGHVLRALRRDGEPRPVSSLVDPVVDEVWRLV